MAEIDVVAAVTCRLLGGHRATNAKLEQPVNGRSYFKCDRCEARYLLGSFKSKDYRGHDNFDHATVSWSD